MRHNSKLSPRSLVALLTLPLCAQDLAPRAYVITAVHSNAVTVTWSFYDEGFDVNGAVPAKNAQGTYSVLILTYYHSLSFLWAIGKYCGIAPLWRGEFQWGAVEARQIGLPLGAT